jgi:hypothetical protein
MSRTSAPESTAELDVTLDEYRRAYFAVLEAYPFLEGKIGRTVALSALGKSVADISGMLATSETTIRKYHSKARRMIGIKRFSFRKILDERRDA